MLASFFLHSNSALSSVISPISWFSRSVSAANMPRLRHKMRCRRGSTRRQVRRSPSTSSLPSESSSPSDSLPNFHRGRLLRSGRKVDSPTFSSLSAQSHTALFSFDCTLNRPRVTAAITVEFFEEPQDDKLQDSLDVQGISDKDGQAHAFQDSVGLTSERKDGEQGVTGLGHAELVVPPTSKKVVHSIEDLYNVSGDPDEFWCKVEHASPDE